MCKRDNPQPHRIYLDIEALGGPTSSNEIHEVIIMNVQPNQTDPMSTMILIGVMQIPTTEATYALHVSFKKALNKDIFLRNKYKLKRCQHTSNMRLYESLNRKQNKLFTYSHKLKEKGYNIFL